MNKEQPCPNCGRCPTCGLNPRIQNVPYYPTVPWQPTQPPYIVTNMPLSIQSTYCTTASATAP